MFRSKLWLTLNLIIIAVLLCLMVITVCGCHEYDRSEGFTVDGAVKLFENLQTANAASAPINPFALPIGAGLAGLIAMLEALRRVEKGKRKYAEHELNNNNNNNSHS